MGATRAGPLIEFAVRFVAVLGLATGIAVTLVVEALTGWHP